MYLPPRDAFYASIAAGTWPDISLFTPVPLIPSLFDAELHDWQYDLLVEVAQLMRAGVRRVLLQTPTGGGKTVMALSALLSARRQGLLAQFLVHRKELLDQTSKRFTSSALGHSFVAAGLPFDPSAGLLLAGVQTLVKRLDLILPPMLIIVDEAHHACSQTYADILEAYPNAFILGLTATPQRLDGRGLNEHFDIMVLGPEVRWLIDNGYLSDFDYYAPSIPDMTGVRTDQQAEEVMDKPTLIGNMVEHYLKLAKDQPGIVFAHSREHSRHLVDAYRGNGVRAAHIDGDMTQKERERIDTGFREREFDLLSNVSLLGEGYDVPAIVYLGLGRRTQSLSLFKQMAGRPLRKYGDSRAIICDHAGNAFTHGLPDDEIEWSLDGRATGAGLGGGNSDASPVRQCRVCFQVSRSTERECPCGEEFPIRSQEIKLKPGELEKLERAALRQKEKEDREARRDAEREAKQKAARQRKREEKECKGHSDLVRLATSRGYTNPEKWASMRMSFRHDYAGRG